MKKIVKKYLKQFYKLCHPDLVPNKTNLESIQVLNSMQEYLDCTLQFYTKQEQISIKLKGNFNQYSIQLLQQLSKYIEIDQKDIALTRPTPKMPKFKDLYKNTIENHSKFIIYYHSELTRNQKEIASKNLELLKLRVPILVHDKYHLDRINSLLLVTIPWNFEPSEAAQFLQNVANLNQFPKI